MGNNAALMVIDVQVGMFSEIDPVHNAGILINNIRTLIERARSSETPIIYVQHNARPGKPLEPGQPGWEIHPAIRPKVGEADLINEIATKAGKKISTLIQRQLQQWIADLPNYIRAYLPISSCES